MRDSAEGFKKDGALVEAARCYAQIGEKSEALSLLEDCYERRCSSIATLKAEPDFDVLQHEAPISEPAAKAWAVIGRQHTSPRRGCDASWDQGRDAV